MMVCLIFSHGFTKTFFYRFFFIKEINAYIKWRLVAKDFY